MEKVVYDLGQYVRHAREVLGYYKVVLVGWSGGGSLSLFYQAQAEQPTITATPAGDPCDLTQAGLQPADGIVFIAVGITRNRFAFFAPRTRMDFGFSVGAGPNTRGLKRRVLPKQTLTLASSPGILSPVVIKEFPRLRRTKRFYESP